MIMQRGDRPRRRRRCLRQPRRADRLPRHGRVLCRGGPRHGRVLCGDPRHHRPARTAMVRTRV